MAKKHKGLTFKGSINIDYEWSMGKAGSRFFTEIRDHKRIMGTKCRKCSMVNVPPRIFCEECFVDDIEWIALPSTGTLVTFGDCYFSTDGKKLSDPWMLGIVKIDGADGGLIHYLKECRPEDLKIGMPMEIVFNEERMGNILDISHFRPLKK
jgi:uncharacterized OB-fold protein